MVEKLLIVFYLILIIVLILVFILFSIVMIKMLRDEGGSKPKRKKHREYLSHEVYLEIFSQNEFPQKSDSDMTQISNGESREK